MTAMASTSLAAYHSLDLTELESKALVAIESFGVSGCTQDDILDRYPDFSNETLTPRFAPLERKGFMVRLGDSRKGHAGRQQKVMRGATFSAGLPMTAAPKKRNPFIAGMMFAAKSIIEADPSFKGSPGAMALKAKILTASRR